MNKLDPDEAVLGGLTLTALKHLGEDAVVVDADNNLCPGWCMAIAGDVALLPKPADNQSLKRIDCYEVVERRAGGAFKLDPARQLYSLWRLHKAEPPDYELLLASDGPANWVNTATLLLLGELRRRAPRAINWAPLFAAGVVEMLDDFEAATGASSSRH